MAGKVDSISIDELWVRISVNLAYRKRSSSIVVKPGVPPKQIRSARNNKLAEQLSTIGELVENLSEQLRMAGLVQRDFMPNQLPNSDKVRWATTFMPATWVSGDIYDVARIDEQHIGFYVADVVGHSMPAAILTIFLKQALAMRETLENNYRIFPPVEVMNNLNVRMSSQKLSGYQFATCCYCLLDTETLELTYCRAGHPYPILIRAGQEPEQLELRGSLLGVFGQAEYGDRTVQLEPGDKLLLYSDGAERFIARYDDQVGFHFKDEFRKLSNSPIVKIIDKLNVFAQNQKTDASEVDDITAVGLEILQPR